MKELRPKFVLTRKFVGEDFIKGVLHLEGTPFTCHTLEAACPEGHNPINPVFRYALPCGEYPIKIVPHNGLAYCPMIYCKPYKNICFDYAEDGHVKPGCVGVGNTFYGTKLLHGYFRVMDGLASCIRAVGITKMLDATLEIRNAEDIIIEEPEANDEPLDPETLNFLN